MAPKGDLKMETKMTYKLKPCPFCGGKAWAYSGSTYHFESGFGWICACKACDAQGEIGKTKAEAIRNWNRRDGKE